MACAPDTVILSASRAHPERARRPRSSIRSPLPVRSRDNNDEIHLSLMHMGETPAVRSWRPPGVLSLMPMGEIPEMQWDRLPAVHEWRPVVDLSFMHAGRGPVWARDAQSEPCEGPGRLRKVNRSPGLRRRLRTPDAPFRAILGHRRGGGFRRTHRRGEGAMWTSDTELVRRVPLKAGR